MSVHTHTPPVEAANISRQIYEDLWIPALSYGTRQCRLDWIILFLLLILIHILLRIFVNRLEIPLGFYLYIGKYIIRSCSKWSFKCLLYVFEIEYIREYNSPCKFFEHQKNLANQYFKLGFYQEWSINVIFLTFLSARQCSSRRY